MIVLLFIIGLIIGDKVIPLLVQSDTNINVFAFILGCIASTIGYIIVSYLRNRCPRCRSQLDDNYHGLSRKWRHCPNCSYCTYEEHMA